MANSRKSKGNGREGCDCDTLKKGMKNLLVRQCVVAAFVGLFMCAGVSVFASGKKEDRIQTVERLIEEKQYNDAILILTQIMKDDPERLDEVEAYMDKIRNARDYYNEIYGRLIDTYEAGNLEESYLIIKELEALDKNPNKATVEALAIAKSTAAVVYNNKQWTAIMDKALKELEQGLYWDAVMTYQTGFGLARDIFEDAQYGEVVVATVDRKTAELKEAVESFLSLQKDFLADLQLAEDSFRSNDPAGLSAVMQRISVSLSSIARLKKRFSDLAVFFESENKAIQASQGNEKDVTHLSYLNRLILGRTKAERPEGIYGVLNTVFHTESERLVKELVPQAFQAFDAAVAVYASGDTAGAERLFIDAASYANSAILALSAKASEVLIDTNLRMDDTARRMVQEDADGYYGLVEAIKAADAYRSLIAIASEVASIASAGENAQTVSTLADLRTQLLSQTSRCQAGLSAWNARIEELTYLSQAGIQATKAQAILESLIGQYREQIEEGTRIEISMATRMANLALSPLEARLAALQTSFRAAQSLLVGVEITTGEGDLSRTILVRYPDRSEGQFIAVNRDATLLESDIRSFISRYGIEKDYVLASSGYDGILSHSREMLAEVQSLSQRSASLAQESRQNILLAARYRQEGEDRIREAESLIPKNDFARARERLETAAERIDLSLSYQEDAALREYRDRQIKDIYSRIQFAENQIVVRDVRNLINSGKEFYSQGDFARSQDALLRAQARWATTNVDPEPEVEYWLQLATTALSMNTGRQINVRDPLYVEMSQVLNRAKEDYAAAKDLMDRKKKDEALTLLSRAEKNILYIQQLFPLNEEASILSLRILQLKDRENFNEIFRKRYNDAIAKIATNPQAAYAELKDLKSISPDYPGIDKAIYDVEIATGIRVPPPDRTVLARSTELYKQAYEIVSRNITAQYPIALSYLNEAIKLNPDNVDAITLKDRIQMNIGGGATVVFSSADQQEYKKAEDLFINQRYFEASAIVNRLLINPDNKRNAKLLELKRRIESKL